jgi:hypothetical protein
MIDTQTIDVEKEDTEIPSNSVEDNITNNNAISSTFSIYKYTKEDIEKFFASGNGQQKIII